MKRKPDFVSPSSLIKQLLEEAHRRKMTEDALCKHLGVGASSLSRWKRGERPAPDPRELYWKDFYLKAAKFLGKSFPEVVASILFFDPQEREELNRWIFESIEAAKRDLPVLALSPQTETALREILANLPNHEGFIHVLHSSFHAYVTDALQQTWFQSSLEAGLASRNKKI